MASRKIIDVIRNQKICSTGSTITVREAARQMASAKVGALLVIEKGRLIGICTERDILNRVVAPGLDADKIRIAEIMTRDPQTVSPEHPVSHALHMMDESDFRHIPVVENGTVRGMISIRDALGEELSEFESELERRDALTEFIM